MILLALSLLAAAVAYYLQRRDELRRIHLLGTHLGQYQIEKLMETLTEGYMRALGEPNPERQQQIWSMLSTTETALAEQFRRFVTDFSRLDAETTRASKLPLSIFYTRSWLPGSTFDFRQVLAVLHLTGLAWFAKTYFQGHEGRRFRVLSTATSAPGDARVSSCSTRR